MAFLALAAPTPSQKQLAKRSFTVPIKPRVGVARNGGAEMVRTYGKFGWEIVVITSNNPVAGIGGGDPSSAGPAPFATSSATTLATSTTSSSEGSDAAAATSVFTTSAATTTAASSSGSETGEVTATPEADQSEYLESVSVGGQTLNLDFDTGSADL